MHKNDPVMFSGYALLTLTALTVLASYLSPIFGFINPWAILPLVPASLLLVVRKEIFVPFLVAFVLTLFATAELFLTTNEELYRYYFDGIGSVYNSLPIIVSLLISYLVVNEATLKYERISETYNKKLMIFIPIFTTLLGSGLKIIMLLVTGKYY